MSLEEIVHTLPAPGRVDSDFGAFTIASDHPPEEALATRPPTPWSQFLASIGSCMASFVAAYCEEAGLPTTGVRLVQRQTPGAEGARIGEFAVTIETPPGFPAEHRAALAEAAAGCTVKRVIEGRPAFRIEVSG